MDGGEDMNSNQDQDITTPTRRGRRIASRLTGVFGTFAVIIGVMCLLILSFVGSKATVSSTVRSALNSSDVRRVIAEELVDRMQNSGGVGAKIIFHVARGEVVDAITTSFGEDNIRSAAGNTASTAYEVLIDGKSNAVMDIQLFADAAFKAMRSADPLIPRFLAPQVDPIDLSNNGGRRDFSVIRTWILLSTGGLLVGGLILLTASWFLSIAPRGRKVRIVGIRVLVCGIVLIGLAYTARSVTFSDDNSGRLAEAIVSFVTSRLIAWSIVIAAFGAIVAAVGGIFHRRITSTHTASA